jgi:hypothetical protein
MKQMLSLPDSLVAWLFRQAAAEQRTASAVARRALEAERDRISSARPGVKITEGVDYNLLSEKPNRRPNRNKPLK